MNTIKLICENCKSPFDRDLKTYNIRQVKKKLPAFCNSSCSTSYNNSKRNKLSYKNNGERIKKLAGNKRDEYSPFRYFFSKCKSRQKECDVDLIYLKELWESQKGICPYTKFKMILPDTMCFSHSSLKGASLDRIDSSKGYIKGNIEYVCLFVNYAKNRFSKNDVQEFIKELKYASEAHMDEHPTFNR